jgi:aspartyl-tRNA(Asn)/glutamyl-tRNA(Gln) amidotransferase subunit B
MTAHDPTFEPVIGLEVHVQLATRTKLFCGCANAYGAEANTQICQVCTGQPGVLPVLNEEALRLAVRAGLALHCTVPEKTKFDRKNYFYPDLPKGYQISQFDQPLNVDGGLEILGDDGVLRTIHIVRAHLEEDAGKTIHPDGMGFSLVDLNRSSIPLLEIVSGPDLRSAAEAHRYLDRLKNVLRYARASECDMEKGSLRCDVNVSVRKKGDPKFGTRVEVKNVNSFKNVERAIEYEVLRQIELVKSGGAVKQETRQWRDAEGATVAMRSKEEAHDYRYFPEPDLPTFTIARAFVETVRAELPEMPDARRARYVGELGISAAAADTLVAERDTADYLDRCLALGQGLDAKEIANFVLGSVLAVANERGISAAAVPLRPETLIEVVRLVASNAVSSQAARMKLLPAILETGKPAAVLLRELGLEQVSDRGAIETIAAEVIAANPKAVGEFKAGKDNAINALVGNVMKASKGKANPNLAREILLQLLRGA